MPLGTPNRRTLAMLIARARAELVGPAADQATPEAAAVAAARSCAGGEGEASSAEPAAALLPRIEPYERGAVLASMGDEGLPLAPAGGEGAEMRGLGEFDELKLERRTNDGRRATPAGSAKGADGGGVPVFGALLGIEAARECMATGGTYVVGPAGMPTAAGESCAASPLPSLLRRLGRRLSVAGGERGVARAAPPASSSASALTSTLRFSTMTYSRPRKLSESAAGAVALCTASAPAAAPGRCVTLELGVSSTSSSSDEGSTRVVLELRRRRGGC